MLEYLFITLIIDIKMFCFQYGTTYATATGQGVNHISRITEMSELTSF